MQCDLDTGVIFDQLILQECCAPDLVLRAGSTVRKEISVLLLTESLPFKKKQALVTMASRYSETTAVMSASDESTVLEDVLCVKGA